MRPVHSGSVAAVGPAVLVHGGAWDIPTDELDAHRDGLARALRVAQRALAKSRPALDVVAETVAALEDHPAFDAGRGAVLDRDGLPQLDAGVMEGHTLRWGAVANVRHLANPIRAARALVDADGQARLLVGEGAERYAAELGLPAVDPTALVVDRERQRFERLSAERGFHTSGAFAGPAPRGTVGCVVLDGDGRLAAGTSTGGAPLTRPGRVGDSPVVGSGFFADDRAGASATGWGEAISTVQLSVRVCDASAESPEAAAREHLDRMRDRVRWGEAEPATGGVIVLTREGRGAWAFTTPRMARGWWSAAGEGLAVDR